MNKNPAASTAAAILTGAVKDSSSKRTDHVCETVTAKMPHRNKKNSRFSSIFFTVMGKIRTSSINPESKSVCNKFKYIVISFFLKETVNLIPYILQKKQKNS